MSIVLSEEQHEAATMPIGRGHLPSGRQVFNTGRVVVGKRYAPAPTGPLGSEAERIQTVLLLRPDPRPWWSLSASDPADRVVMRAIFLLGCALAGMALAGWL